MVSIFHFEDPFVLTTVFLILYVIDDFCFTEFFIPFVSMFLPKCRLLIFHVLIRAPHHLFYTHAAESRSSHKPEFNCFFTFFINSNKQLETISSYWTLFHRKRTSFLRGSHLIRHFSFSVNFANASLSCRSSASSIICSSFSFWKV